jgi:hypothetical protein
MRPPLRPVLLLLATLLLGCEEFLARADIVELCGVPLVDYSSWPIHDEGMFTIRIPPDLEGPNHGGFDSFVGRWESNRKVVRYDWGMNSNDLFAENQPNADAIEYCDALALGADRLALISYPATKGWRTQVSAAHWARLAPTESIVHEYLTVFGSSDDRADLAEFLTVLSTVRIRLPEARKAWPGTMTGLVICGTVEDPAGCTVKDDSVEGRTGR